MVAENRQKPTLPHDHSLRNDRTFHHPTALLAPNQSVA
jgi:hypothetical protein